MLSPAMSTNENANRVRYSAMRAATSCCGAQPRPLSPMTANFTDERAAGRARTPGSPFGSSRTSVRLRRDCGSEQATTSARHANRDRHDLTLPGLMCSMDADLPPSGSLLIRQEAGSGKDPRHCPSDVSVVQPDFRLAAHARTYAPP